MSGAVERTVKKYAGTGNCCLDYTSEPDAIRHADRKVKPTGYQFRRGIKRA